MRNQFWNTLSNCTRAELEFTSVLNKDSTCKYARDLWLS